MKTLCRFIFLVLLVLLSCSAFAQVQNTPKDPKVYSFSDLPFDSEPHWMEVSDLDIPGLKNYGVGYIFIDGIGFGRTREEAKKQGVAKFGDELPPIKDSITLGLTALVYMGKENAKTRQLIVYLQATPLEGETKIGSVVLDVNIARKLLNQCDDLLRIGRKWRNEGTANEDKKVAMSTLNSSGTPFDDLNLAIEKTKSSSGQTWSVWSNRVYFKNSDLASLSKFRDKVEMAVRWLERQR